MKETCRRELFPVDTQMLKCSCVVERDSSVAICPSACTFVVFFLYTPKRYSSFFFYIELMNFNM